MVPRFSAGEAFLEQCSLRDLANQYKTPLYVYSLKQLHSNIAAYKEAFAKYPTQICYAVKANSHLALLKTLFAAEFGADVVSLGELRRALKAGAKANTVVFSGVGKTKDEIEFALTQGVLSLNVESLMELVATESVAKNLTVKAPVSLRINPHVDAQTNAKITTGLYETKFGLSDDELARAISLIKESKHLALKGIACHIGSQMLDLSPIKAAALRMGEFAKDLMASGLNLEYLDMGGGLGIAYQGEKVPPVKEYADILISAAKSLNLKLIIEPGRSLVADTGLILTTVICTKKTPRKNFAVVDAAMNDLIRPSLYDAYHEIIPVKESSPSESSKLWDIVGPVCETSDTLGHNRNLKNIADGDLLAILNTGGYGASMASNYNSRPRAAEVLVDGREPRLISKRETLEDLWSREIVEE